MRTIGPKWPTSAPITDSAACCDDCGVRWRRSQLKVNAESLLMCPDCRGGRTALEQDRRVAELARARAAKRAGRYAAKGPRGTFDKTNITGEE